MDGLYGISRKADNFYVQMTSSVPTANVFCMLEPNGSPLSIPSSPCRDKQDQIEALDFGPKPLH